MNVVLLGAPGSGKGTQAALVCKNLHLAHISTGDLLRQAVKQGTELGLQAKEYMDKGAFVPMELVLKLLEERLKQPDCKKGFVLDGFPRNKEQLEAISKKIKTDVAVLIQIEDSALEARLTGRRVCTSCGETYHISHLVTERCPKCGGALMIRSDDNVQTIRNRLQVFHKETQPMIEEYKTMGILEVVEGDADMLTVYQGIMEAIKKHDNH